MENNQVGYIVNLHQGQCNCQVFLQDSQVPCKHLHYMRQHYFIERFQDIVQEQDEDDVTNLEIPINNQILEEHNLPKTNPSLSSPAEIQQ